MEPLSAAYSTLQATCALASSFWLSLAPLAPPPCGQDAYEPNDLRAAARPLVARSADAVVCPRDTDWFAFSALRGQRLAVSVFYGRAEAPDRPLVFPPYRRAPIGSGYVAEGEVGTMFTAPRDGKYRVRVRHRGTEPVPYVLLVSPGALEDR